MERTRLATQGEEVDSRHDPLFRGMVLLLLALHVIVLCTTRLATIEDKLAIAASVSCLVLILQGSHYHTRAIHEIFVITLIFSSLWSVNARVRGLTVVVLLAVLAWWRFSDFKCPLLHDARRSIFSELQVWLILACAIFWHDQTASLSDKLFATAMIYIGRRCVGRILN